MTFAPHRHAQTYRRAEARAAPPPIGVTTGAVERGDFSLTDLGTGSGVALTLHRLRVLLPDRLSHVQVRIDEGEAIDLPLPARAGVFALDDLAPGKAHRVALRLVDFDPESGIERIGPWSPEAVISPTRFRAANLLSDTIDPAGGTTGLWSGDWTDTPDADGFASAAGTARGAVAAMALPEPGSRLLATAVLRAGTAASVAIEATSMRAVLAVTAEGSVSLAAAEGVGDAAAWVVEQGEGLVRVALAATFPAGVDALALAIEGAAFRDADLRLWDEGEAVPEPERVAGETGVIRLAPPVVEDFGRDALETMTLADGALPFTLFGDEIADSRQAPARRFGLGSASVEAGGAGYADGEHPIAVEGGEGGVLRLTVEGGAVVAAAVEAPGRRYVGAATADLSTLPGGGSGATISVATAPVWPDWWPAVNEGRTRAAWAGRALGAAGFVVEGFVADGSFRPAGREHTLASGAIVSVDADGHWRARADGSTDGLAEDEGERVTLGLVVSNGGTRAVIAMALGFAGGAAVPMRIVGTPRLAGSGRLGDRLVALPGQVAGGTPSAQTVEYQWLLDGVALDGATGPALRLVPDLTPEGASVAARIVWREGDRSESWETPAVTVAPWKVAADGDALTLGALTPATMSGLPIGPAGTRVASGDEDGRFIVEDREGIAFLRPASGPSVPGSDPVADGAGATPGTLTLGLTDGRSLAVTVEAGVYTCATGDDLAALAQSLSSVEGRGVHGFDFASGGRIVLWNSGDWGHTDAPLGDLVVVARGAPVVVESYDVTEPTAVTGPVGFDAARDLAWRVDLVQAVGNGDPRTPALAVEALAGRVAIEDARVLGATLMRERSAAAIEPGGTAIGGALRAIDGEAPGILALARASVADLGRVVATAPETALAAFKADACRVHRCGPRALGFGAGVGRIALRGSVVQDPTWPSPARRGAFLSVEPEGATGYGPVYRAGMAVEIADCLFFPGQGAPKAMDGIVLGRDRALGDGTAEADHGFVYAPVTIERTMVIAGEGVGLALSSGTEGRIADSAFLADARVTAGGALVHANAWRPLDERFALERVIAGADALGAGVARSGVATLAPSAYATAFAGDAASAFAPRIATGIAVAFRPTTLTAQTDTSASGVAGAVDRLGQLKIALPSLPAVEPVPWGRASWGRARMATAIGWGELAVQPDEPFAIVATRTSGVAPAGIRFELTGLTPEERLYDEILWDFEEDYPFESPPARARIERSSRFGRGYAAAHCFVEAGTWRVRAWHHRRSGEIRAADAVTVTITDARSDPRYTRGRAICSLVGDFSGFEDYRRFTDLDEATDWLKSGDFRYLVLRDGERFPFAKRQRFLRNGSKLARSYTGTARPVLEPSGNVSLFLVKDDREAGNAAEGASIDGIELVNPRYDPARLSIGANPDGSGPLEEWTNVKLISATRRDSPPLTVFRTRTYGCAISIASSYLAAQGSAFVADCDFGGWYDYGCLGDFDGAILGSTIAQPEGTLSGPGNKTHGRPAEWAWLAMNAWTRLTDGSFRSAVGSNQQVGRTFGLRQRLQPQSFRLWRARPTGSGSKPALDGTEQVWVDRLGNGPAPGAVFDETTGLWAGGHPAPGFDAEAQTYTFQPGDLDDGYHLFVQALTLAYADHGPIRVVKMDRFVVAQNYLHSRGGWASGGATDQPALRLATYSGTLGSDQCGCTVGNHFVGGEVVVAYSGGDGPRDFGHGHRFDYNLLEASPSTKRFVNADCLPFSAQGNVYHAPASAEEHREPGYTLAETEIVPADENAAVSPVRFRYETMVVDRPEPGTLALFTQATSRPVLSGEGLAVYVPNQEIDTSGATNVVATAVPPRGFAPGDGHPWLGQASGRVPALDHRGQERPVPAAVGALEAFVPATLRLGPAARLGANGALSTSGRLTVVARLRRDETGRRALFEAPGGHTLAFGSPGDVVTLAIAGEGGQPIIAHELSTVSAPVGDWRSIMLAVDLGDGVTGGLAGERSVVLWIDGRPVWEDFTTGPARLADQSALAFFSGEAPASLGHWLWADGTVALDPAGHWDAFFDDAGRVRELGPSGQAAGMVPEVFVALRRPTPPGDRRAPAGAFALGHNLGRGGALAGSGWSEAAEAGFHVG